MQIVIEISEEEYQTYINHTEAILDSSIPLVHQDLLRAVINGTPLPKGHGKIIDYGYVVDAIDDWVNAEEYRYTNATDYLRKRVANTPTIIEADKGKYRNEICR